MRGQWLSDALRDSGKGGGWTGDTWQPAPRGVPHIWKWADTETLLDESCTAIPESKTARRSLIFTNPGLERSITHTMNAGIQVIEPGEIAWAHRHSISALRFVIEGPPGLMTVVDGDPCPMQPRDMVLTPNALWHDHKNESSGRALWLDVLDGPLVGALNQTTFQDYGECQQPVTNAPPPPSLHFPWADMADRLDSLADTDADERRSGDGDTRLRHIQAASRLCRRPPPPFVEQCLSGC
jgi:1-hydroxy-2-naphthoate dioxygenase